MYVFMVWNRLQSEAQADLKHAEILLPQLLSAGILGVSHLTCFGGDL